MKNYVNPLLNKESNIFNQKINNKYKLVPFNTMKNSVGETKYFPSVSKEWVNNVYFFNNNNVKNFSVYDMNINRLLKGYFKLYFNNNEIISKFIPRRLKRLSLNRIFVSKAEIKHTSSKAIITVYVYNREGISLLKKLRVLKKSLFEIKSFFFKCRSIAGNYYDKLFKDVLKKELIYIRRYKLKLNLNKLKFQDKFLNKLAKLISKFYNKKVEFNIIKLKSIAYNTSIFTEIIRLKLRRKRANIWRIINFVLAKGIILKENSIKERSRLVKNVNFDLIENKYKNLNVNSIVNNSDLDQVLTDLYDNEEESNVKDVIFNSIKHKIIGGMRLEIKGRLTKRYRADRSVYKVKWKGGLKNIDSSYKGLSAVNFRGNANSNVEYSIGVWKRRVGAFAVKGWISGR